MKTNVMTKADLMGVLFKHHGLSRTESDEIVNRLFDAMASALSEGREVKITNFGIFDVRIRAARPGRNPRTNEPVLIPPREIVTFRPAPKILEAKGKKVPKHKQPVSKQTQAPRGEPQ